MSRAAPVLVESADEYVVSTSLEALAPALSNEVNEFYTAAINDAALANKALKPGERVLRLGNLCVCGLHGTPDVFASTAGLELKLQFKWCPSEEERKLVEQKYGRTEPAIVDNTTELDALVGGLQLLRWNNAMGDDKHGATLKLALLWGLQRQPGSSLNVDCHYSGVFRQNYRLHDFPFDAQRVRVELEIFNTDGWHVVLAGADAKAHAAAAAKQAAAQGAASNGGDVIFSATAPDEWQVHRIHAALTKRKRYAKMLRINVPIQRRYHFYTSNFFAPTAMITLLTAAAGLFERDEFEQRSSVILSILLTVIFFKISMQQTLPVKAYNTALDDFGNKSIGFVMLLFLESGVMCVHSKTSSSNINLLDMTLFIVFSLAYAVYCCVAFRNARTHASVLSAQLAATGEHPAGWVSANPKKMLM